MRRNGNVANKIALSVKRLLDVLAASTLLLLFSPLWLITWLLVRFMLGAPALFRQSRPGLAAKPFTLLKFRTMAEKRGPDGEPLPDAERMTKFGSWLRRYSLDELPQLWNVAKGDMSLVGPRPLLMQYIERYTPEQAQRHQAKPGITGLAQVGGRNAISWEDKFALDIYYVQHWSLWLDLHILARTVRAVLFPKGAY